MPVRYNCCKCKFTTLQMFCMSMKRHETDLNDSSVKGNSKGWLIAKDPIRRSPGKAGIYASPARLSNLSCEPYPPATFISYCKHNNLWHVMLLCRHNTFWAPVISVFVRKNFQWILQQVTKCILGSIITFLDQALCQFSFFSCRAYLKTDVSSLRSFIIYPLED